MTATIRPATQEDLQPVARVVRACDEHDLGEPDPPEDVLRDLRAEWERPGHEAWVAVEPQGTVVGWTAVEPEPEGALIDPNGGVLPERRGAGIGSALLDVAESRALELPRGQGRLRTVVSGENASAIELFEGRGYARTERSWMLTIDFDGPPPAPEWPAGFSVRAYRPGEDDRSLYELIQDAFADNEGYDRSTRTFERWSSFMLGADVDPELYHVVEREGRLAGAALCPSYSGMGWIRQLAVRRDDRGRGLGMAILRHAFAELYRRGHRKVGLTVDSWNTTGAKRLYERAGMRVVLVHDWYEKPLS